MKSSLVETLLNTLFLSSLECVLGSVVRQDSRYSPYPVDWNTAESFCSQQPGWTLLSQQYDIDKFVPKLVSHMAWIGLKHYHWNATWSDGTDYQTSSWAGYRQCATINSITHRISFSPCSTHHYFYCYGGSSQSTITFVSISKDWDKAKKYCNDHYVDLVILKEDEQFKALPVDLYYIWTDIHRDGPGGDWTSSTGDPIYENWAEGQPTADGDCVALSNKDKKMANFRCSSSLDYYCFLDNLVLVKEDKTWEEALEHCRAMDSADPNRNDLISISGPSDQHTVWSRVNEATTNEVWTGLRYLAHKWFWVDGTTVPYQDLPTCPVPGQYCGTLVRDNSATPWNIRNCNEKRNFLCYEKYPRYQ